MSSPSKRSSGSKSSQGSPPKRQSGSKSSQGSPPKRQYGSKSSRSSPPKRQPGSKTSQGSPPKQQPGSKSSQGSPPKRQPTAADSEETNLSLTEPETVPLEELWRCKRDEDLTEEELQAKWDAIADQDTEENLFLPKYYYPSSSQTTVHSEEEVVDIPSTSKIPSVTSSAGGPSEDTFFTVRSKSKSPSVGSLTSIHSAISEDAYALTVLSPILSPDYVAESMHMQVQRLYMQKKLAFDPDYIKSNHYPMINLPQAKYIIKNVVCEWENRLQKWFDHLLKLKLKEQQDAYEKFSNDQIKRADNSAPNPSYLM